MMAGIAVDRQPDMRVVAEATTATGAGAVSRHRYDVTLMDIRMPKINGIMTISAIRYELPQARIIVLTTAVGDVQAVRAFKAGAVGYLLKNLSDGAGGNDPPGSQRTEAHPPEIAQQIAEHAADDSITTRELEVLRGVANGSSNKIIASDLGISEHTVKNHLKSILAKLGANDRTHAVTIAVKRGLLLRL